MAQKLAFKKTLVPGATMPAQVASLYASIKAYITNAGFSVLSFSDSGIGGTYIDFMRAGAVAADTSDDCPHWAISLASDTITVQCVHGAAFDDVAAYTQSVGVIDASTYTTGMPDHLVRFYCDAATGMFWLYVTNTSTGAHTGALVATSLRRYPADTTQGLLCRYGLLEARLSRQFLPAYYADNTTGAKSSACQFELWSPLLGDDRGLSPKRHPASPMPAMSAPVFIQAAAYATSACMPGELERVQMLPDGDYTLEQVLTPGIMALPNVGPGTLSLALPYTAFTVL